MGNGNTDSKKRAEALKKIKAHRKAFDESFELTDEQRAEFYKILYFYPEGGASDKTIKNYFKAKIGPDIHRKNQAAEEAKNQKVTPAKKKIPVEKTKPINANIFNIPLGEKETPVKETKPEKTKEVSKKDIKKAGKEAKKKKVDAAKAEIKTTLPQSLNPDKMRRGKRKARYGARLQARATTKAGVRRSIPEHIRGWKKRLNKK